MKKKSEALSIFGDFVIMIGKNYNMKICVLYTDFGKFNSNAITEYFDHTGIT